MGRSKKSPSSSNALKNTPKTPVNVKTGKRPLPSEEDEDDSIVKMDNGFHTDKKGKFVDEDESVSYEGESQDDVDEDEDSNDDDDDDDDDDEDEDEDEEDDDDDDSEDEDLQESDSSADLVKQTPTMKEKKPDTKESASKNIKTPVPGPQMLPVSAKKTNVDSSKQANKTPKSQHLAGPEFDLKTSPSKASAVKTNLAHLVVLRPPTQLENLKTAMIKQGVDVENVQMVNCPMALITCGCDSADKIVNKPISVDGNTLHVLKLQGLSASLDAFKAGNITTALFVTGLPKSVTEEQIKATLPNHSQPISLKLLTEGRKNKFFNAARIDFSTTRDAATAFQKLSSVTFENRPLRISYARGLVDSNTASDLRGQTKTLLAVQLDTNISENQLKNIFNNAIKLNLITKGSDRLCYMEFPNSDQATSAYDAHNGSNIGQSKLVLRFVPTRPERDEHTLHVSNVPFESTSNQVLQMFPGALTAVMISKGNYIVNFPSGVIRKEAATSVKELNGRKLYISCNGGLDQNICLLRNLPFDVKQCDIEGLLPTASKIELHCKPNGSFTGNATVTFATALACKEAMNKKISFRNRMVAITLKRVSLSDASDSLDKKRPAQPAQVSLPAKKQKVLPVVEKKTVKQNVKVPPQVGSASEDEDEDEEMESTEEGEELSSKAHVAGSDAETDDDEASDDDDEEDDDDDDDDDDDGDEDEEDEENSEASEEAPVSGSKKQSGDRFAKNSKVVPTEQFPKSSNFNKDAQRGGFKPQHRGGGLQQQQRGGGRGFHRGGGDFGAHKPHGGGGRGRGFGGGGRGGGGRGGGFRGRGRFNNRGGGK